MIIVSTGNSIDNQLEKHVKACKSPPRVSTSGETKTRTEESWCQVHKILNLNSDGMNGLSWRTDEGQKARMKKTRKMQETGKAKKVPFGTDVRTLPLNNYYYCT